MLSESSIFKKISDISEFTLTQRLLVKTTEKGTEFSYPHLNSGKRVIVYTLRIDEQLDEEEIKCVFLVVGDLTSPNKPFEHVRLIAKTKNGEFYSADEDSLTWTMERGEFSPYLA